MAIQKDWVKKAMGHWGPGATSNRLVLTGHFFGNFVTFTGLSSPPLSTKQKNRNVLKYN